MPHHGFLRVAAAAPELRVADCRYNAERTLDLLRAADDAGANLVVFPEMGLTGYTCHDLFHDQTLVPSAAAALDTLLGAAEMFFGGVAVVGLPVYADGRLFNCAAVFRGGNLLGVVPKSFLPNYKEFYDARYFAPASAAVADTVTLAGRTVPFGTDLLFESASVPGFVLGVEICEDLWTPIAPSSLQALAGATVLANLSASNETIGKASYRRQLVAQQSGRCLAGYVYAGCGPGESTTDVVFGGHCMVAECGTMLAESARFRRDGHLTVADLDPDRIAHDRVVTGTFHGNHLDAQRTKTFRRIKFTHLIDADRGPALVRPVDAHPFVPSDPATLRERCDDIFHTQVCALGKRLDHAGRPTVAIGVSGGLDSTLALLVVCKTFDALGEPRAKIQARTMPGFGTTTRTLANSRALMTDLGVTAREIDIRPLCLEQLRALGHSPFGISLDGATVDGLSDRLRNLPVDKRNDLVFENVQARVRTSLLMNTGFVIGTGDLSELALGWCTYNADHMSMYNPNIGIPKTLVKFLVRWAAQTEFTGSGRDTLMDVVATEISPELLPPSATGEIVQSTEQAIGPYELHDFFLYHFLRFGAAPEKILFLAGQAKFNRPYTPDEIRRWLAVFLRRFFANQFKRSCVPDGPKVGSVSLSPRGDWRMPSDATARAWLDAVERG
ncbi:NAD(+) synthase [Fimbriiglobus ruber]|uniref:Glutamine-dependent NAD(+) synthetase n=1 Tax=Fimbriiglobus ruber TaxID=1908690 RepID=A0A225D8W3_9BACT|nr:NAD(+) synthase [Fimbriiglobus ruber]OWK38001.1 NAD synthetase [Fimbriiglobus ruber]